MESKEMKRKYVSACIQFGDEYANSVKALVRDIIWDKHLYLLAEVFPAPIKADAMATKANNNTSRIILDKSGCDYDLRRKILLCALDHGSATSNRACANQFFNTLEVKDGKK